MPLPQTQPHAPRRSAAAGSQAGDAALRRGLRLVDAGAPSAAARARAASTMLQREALADALDLAPGVRRDASPPPRGRSGAAGSAGPPRSRLPLARLHRDDGRARRCRSRMSPSAPVSAAIALAGALRRRRRLPVAANRRNAADPGAERLAESRRARRGRWPSGRCPPAAAPWQAIVIGSGRRRIAEGHHGFERTRPSPARTCATSPCGVAAIDADGAGIEGAENAERGPRQRGPNSLHHAPFAAVARV